MLEKRQEQSVSCFFIVIRIGIMAGVFVFVPGIQPADLLRIKDQMTKIDIGAGSVPDVKTSG